jgi:uncharacterized membrane protein YoaK (UPF0700 family)
MADVMGWLTLGGLFTAHITGNLVVMAADAVRSVQPNPASVLAVPVFVIGVAAASRLCRPDGWGEQSLLFVQATLLACVLGLAIVTHPSSAPHGIWAGAVGMVAMMAMAVQNAMLHLTHRSAPMTGNIVVATLSLLDLLAHEGNPARARTQWRSTWPTLTGFIAGCLVGALATAFLGDAAWLVPTAAAFGIFGLADRSGGSINVSPHSHDADA